MTQDKLSHAFAGIAIAALIYPFGIVTASVAVILAALGKEIVWDGWLARGTAEAGDALVTMTGGAFYVAWMRLFA